MLEPNDFLDEVAKIDPWYQTILKAGYSSGPDFAALLYTIRKQNESDPNKWIIYISDDFKLLATDPTWKHNLVTKFSISNSKPVDIDIELTSQAPEGSSEDQDRDSSSSSRPVWSRIPSIWAR